MTVVGYLAPEALEEAVGVLAAHGDEVAVLAGGTMLLPELLQAGTPARTVLDLARLGLRGVRRREDGATAVGASTTYADLLAGGEHRDAAERLPVLAAAAGAITGGRAIRAQATIGGSACYANPSSDVPACLVAMHAQLRLHGPGGVREVAAEEFFVDAFATAREPDELLVEIIVPPRPPASTIGYRKLKLCESSWPIVTAAATICWDEEGECAGAELVVGGATRTPIAVDVTDLLGAAGPGDAAPEVARRVRGALAAPWGDVLADAGYRTAVAGTIAARALLDAVAARRSAEGTDRDG